MENVLRHSAGFAGLRRMFLLVSPNETSFETLNEVPKYVDEAVPYFFVLVVLESCVLVMQGKELPRPNDSYSSLANGLLSLLHSLLFRSTELAAFVWVFEHFNIITLPWDSPWTWLLTLIGVDFVYYWVHRFGHEVNIIWSGHQTYHSSEEYNLTTALRQSAIQKYFSWVFYMPLGLFLPPSIYLVHIQFNLLYQFWIHTETIDKLGPLEWFLSTPSHHRVHHGRNPYCIDKNYGGVLIIWDRLFGTFQAEKSDEKVVYGLVHNIDDWEPLYSQACHLMHIAKTAWSIDGLSNKLSVLCKGPGWTPGSPRLGHPEGIPEVEQNPVKYDRTMARWRQAYVWIHFAFILLVWHPTLGVNKESLSTISMVTNIAYIIVSLSIFGSMYNNSSYADFMELIRCVVFLVAVHFYPMSFLGTAVYWIYVASTAVWSIVIGGKLTGLKSAKSKKKVQ